MADARNRSAFLGTGASAIGGARLASGWKASKDVPLPVITITPGAFDARFDGDLFYVDVPGQATGWIKGVQGGTAEAEIVTEKIGPDHIAKKHIANVKYNEFSIQLGIGMTKGLYEWVKDSFDKSYARKDGTVVAADFNFKPVASASFFQALITEVGVPTLDSTSKDPAYMVLKFAPTETRFKAPPDKAPGPAPKPQPTNFRLEIDGLDTSRVSKVDAFTIKQSAVQGSDGTLSAVEDVPNLSVWVDADPKGSWTAWEDDFVRNGNSGDDKERSGSLIFLDPGGKQELFRLSFSHLGVFKGTPSGTADGYPVKWELYGEDVRLAFGDGAWA
jgi:hypothetical protein